MSYLLETWQNLGTAQGNVIGGAISLLIALGAYLLRPSVRLRWGRANASFHGIVEGEHPIRIITEKFYLQNTGRKTASNVEFVFAFPPKQVSVWEPRNYTKTVTPEGHLAITIPQIAPRELLIIDSLYVNTDPAIVASVKCADCLGKEVEFRVLRHFGDKINVLFGVLCFVGLAWVLSLAFNYLVKAPS